MSMTFEEYQKAHKEMWTWLAENPGKDKNSWSGWDFGNGNYYNNIKILNRCFACAYTQSIDNAGHTECDLCPIDWSGIDASSIHKHSYHCQSMSIGDERPITETEFDTFSHMLDRYIYDKREIDTELWHKVCMSIANKEWKKR